MRDRTPGRLEQSAHIVAEGLKVAAGEQEDRQNTGGKESKSGAERAQDANGKRSNRAPQRTARGLRRRADTELEQTDDGNGEGKATKVMTSLEHSPWLPAESPERRQGNEHRNQECGAAKGAIEAAAPPRDEPALVAAAPDDIGAQQGQEHQHHAEQFTPKPRSAGNLRQR